MSPRTRLALTMTVRELNKGEQAALDAVKFCLIKGTTPFRVDVNTLVKIIESRILEEPKR